MTITTELPELHYEQTIVDMFRRQVTVVSAPRRWGKTTLGRYFVRRELILNNGDGRDIWYLTPNPYMSQSYPDLHQVQCVSTRLQIVGRRVDEHSLVIVDEPFGGLKWTSAALVSWAKQGARILLLFTPNPLNNLIEARLMYTAMLEHNWQPFMFFGDPTHKQFPLHYGVPSSEVYGVWHENQR